MRHPRIVAVALLLALPLSALIAGYAGVRQAEAQWRQGNYPAASEAYARAARILFWRADLWEKAGISASLGGEHQRALTHLEKHTPQTAEGWFRLAASHYQLGDLDAAHAATLRGTLAFDSLHLYDLQALIRYELEDWSAERTSRENQARLGSQDAFAHYRLGLLLMIHFPEDALPALTRASTLNPEVAPAVETLRAALALAFIQTDDAEKMIAIGRGLSLVQEWNLSLEAFSKAVEADENNAGAWAWLGEANQQTGQDGGAELERAVSLNPSNPTVRALRGLYWERRENYQKALEEYSAAAEFDAADPAWQAGIARTHAGLGDLLAAIEAYRRAIELAPTDATYWRMLAVFCAETSAYVDEIGLPAAEQAVRLSPKDPSMLDALGLSYFASGRHASAEVAFTRAIELAPDYLPAHIHLALNDLVQGNHAAAFDTLTHVRDTDATGIHGKTALQLLERYFP
jgi:tetratricopeptide (TPR) repeat protein